MNIMQFIPVKVCSQPIDMLADNFIEFANQRIDHIGDIPFIEVIGEVKEIENNFCVVIGKLDRSAN